MIELKNIGITFNKNTPDENTALTNSNVYKLFIWTQRFSKKIMII